MIERNSSDCKYGEIFTHRVDSIGALNRSTVFSVYYRDKHETIGSPSHCEQEEEDKYFARDNCRK
jgi:hypothetical protein